MVFLCVLRNVQIFFSAVTGIYTNRHGSWTIRKLKFRGYSDRLLVHSVRRITYQYSKQQG